MLIHIKTHHFLDFKIEEFFLEEENQFKKQLLNISYKLCLLTFEQFKNHALMTKDSFISYNNNQNSHEYPVVEKVSELIISGLKNFTQKELVFNKSWFAFYRQGGFIKTHNHLGEKNIYASCYYIETDPIEDFIAFFPEQDEKTVDLDKLNNIEETSGEIYKIYPRAGSFLLWPAHLHHRTFPHQSKLNKSAISYNIGEK